MNKFRPKLSGSQISDRAKELLPKRVEAEALWDSEVEWSSEELQDKLGVAKSTLEHWYRNWKKHGSGKAGYGITDKAKELLPKRAEAEALWSSGTKLNDVGIAEKLGVSKRTIRHWHRVWRMPDSQPRELPFATERKTNEPPQDRGDWSEWRNFATAILEGYNGLKSDNIVLTQKLKNLEYENDTLKRQVEVADSKVRADFRRKVESALATPGD